MHVEAFGDLLRGCGIANGVGVPCSYFTPLVNHTSRSPQLDYISATSEGEAVAIGAGLVTAGKPAFVLMQNSGLGNAVNPITSLLHIYRIPVMLLISHRGQPGLTDEPQHELMGRITEELARMCGLRTEVFDPETFEASLRLAQQDGVPAAWICRKGSFQAEPVPQPPAPAFQSGAVHPAVAGSFVGELVREQALAAILPLLNAGLEGTEASPTAVISTTGKTSRELYELDDGDHSRRNRFYMVGSMGCASAFGLGVARARPERSVIVIDGDGAALMKLGSLATIGHCAPANFHHLILDNGAHDSTGGQPTPSPTVDFASLALACGYRHAETVQDAEGLQEAFARQLEMEGPTLLRMAIRIGARKDLGRPTLSPRSGWERFRDFLQQSPGD